MQPVTRDDDCEECVVAIHIPPIKGIAQVTFKVVDLTEPTLSMPMLVATDNRLLCRGEDTMLRTAAGEVAPLTSDGDDWYLKVLINNENVFVRIDVWAACHECPPSWIRCLSPENVERRTTLDKVAHKSVAAQRQVSPRTTETKAPEYIGALAGKYQWDDRPGGDAD